MKTSMLWPLRGSAVVGLMVACVSPSSTGPAVSDQISVTIDPPGGAVNVSLSAPVSATFGHPMDPGMERFLALHEGDIHGPMVPGRWEWSTTGTFCVFVPDQPLRPGSHYTIHFGGGITDRHGHGLDFEHLEHHQGGNWVHAAMMGSGSHQGHSGEHGWRHANGSYGMHFSFTTE